MFGMMISQASSTFRVLGLRLSSLRLFFEKKKKDFVIALARTLIYGFHTNIGYDNISSKFDFRGPRLKVNVNVFCCFFFVVVVVVVCLFFVFCCCFFVVVFCFVLFCLFFFVFWGVFFFFFFFFFWFWFFILFLFIYLFILFIFFFEKNLSSL